jgi:DNA recombination protein RmuC
MAIQDISIFFCGFCLGVFIALYYAQRYFAKRQGDFVALQDQLKNAFAALSKEALVANIDLVNASFKNSVEQIYKASEHDRSHNQQQLNHVITPLKESLLSVDKKVRELEIIRQGAYSGLTEQIENLLKSQNILHKETATLARALNAPSIKGRWGEMQLRRVVELSGLSAHCDFVEQLSIKHEEELARPDMIVTLPTNKIIVIDAKVPLDIFGDFTAEDNQAVLGASLRRHLQTLKKKSYYKLVGESPEFTVMFLPGEAFLHRALAADPLLLDYAAQQNIIIATPITLIALLKAVSFGFKQEAVAQNIEEVRRLSQQLIDRVAKVAEHFEKLGRHLKQATDSYNQTLSSLDSRVLVTARKLAEIKSVGCEDNTPPNLAFVDIIPKPVTLGASELGETGS